MQQVLDYLIAHDGTYYLPYHPFATRTQFQACYPKWKAVWKKKQEIDSKGMLVSGFYSDYFIDPGFVEQGSEELLAKAKEQAGLVECCSRYEPKVKSFLDAIFMQLYSQEVIQLIGSLSKENPSNEELYSKLSNKISVATPNPISLMMRKMRALGVFQEEVGFQVLALIGPFKPIQGYLEIGYPGRMIKPLKKRLNLKGPFLVAAEKSSLTDYIEAGFPLPYDRFIPLNDYAPIDSVEEYSLDLVCLYIGLHHIPQEKIDPFLASISRILRPGGHFILMDHDASSSEVSDLADAAHTLFNLGTGVPAEENSREYRNFQSIEYWTTLVAKHGLIRTPQPLYVREGDPTMNSLVRFDKPYKESAYLACTERSHIKTFLTAPEWQNVRSAKAYAAYIRENPVSGYPYFQDIATFWRVFRGSWNAARRHASFYSYPYLRDIGRYWNAYMPFMEIIRKIVDAGLQIQQVAGHKSMQLDIKHAKKAPHLCGCRCLYETSIPLEPETALFAFEVPVQKLSETLRFLNDKRIELVYIHDF